MLRRNMKIKSCAALQSFTSSLEPFRNPLNRTIESHKFYHSSTNQRSIDTQLAMLKSKTKSAKYITHSAQKSSRANTDWLFTSRHIKIARDYSTNFDFQNNLEQTFSDYELAATQLLKGLKSQNDGVSFQIHNDFVKKVASILASNQDNFDTFTVSNNAVDTVLKKLLSSGSTNSSQKSFMNKDKNTVCSESPVKDATISVLNVLIENFAQFNFSIVNKCLRFYLSQQQKEEFKGEFTYSIRAITQVIQHNPERVASSWEFFMDFISNNKSLKSVTTDSNQTPETTQLKKNLLKSLLDKLIENKSEEDNLLVSAKILFLLQKFQFEMQSKGLTFSLPTDVVSASQSSETISDLILFFEKCNILSLLILTSSRYVFGLAVNDVNATIAQSLQKLLEANTDSAEKLEDLILSYQILTTLKDASATSFFLPEKESALKLVMKYAQNNQDFTNGEDSTMYKGLLNSSKIVNNHLKNVSNYLNSLIRNEKTSEEQNGIKDDLISIDGFQKFQNFKNFAIQLVRDYESQNSSNPSTSVHENVLISTVKADVLRFLGIELNDTSLLLEMYHSYVSKPWLNHDTLQVKMLQVFTYQALLHLNRASKDSLQGKQSSTEKQKAKTFITMAETMMADCLNHLDSNINYVISQKLNNKKNGESDLEEIKAKILAIRNREIEELAQCLRLLILLYAEHDFDRSIDIFNSNVSILKKLDLATNNITDQKEKITVQSLSKSLYLVDSLIKAALLRQERELAYVIYDKSVGNQLVVREGDKLKLKQNFNMFGRALEENSETVKDTKERAQGVNFRSYVLDHIKKL